VASWLIRARSSRTALFTIEGELDDISAPGQTIAAHDLCSSLPKSMREHHLQKGVGHYGIFNGRKWREEIMPKLRKFVRAYDVPAHLGSITAHAKSEPLPSKGAHKKRLAMVTKKEAAALKAASKPAKKPVSPQAKPTPP
jgi:hypothetical protein